MKCLETYAGTVRKAEPAVQTHSGIVGWNLYSEHGGIWLTSENCAQTPEPGEQIVFGGKGFGHIVTSIEIGGRFYR
jgi:hypothetical protein